MTTVTLNETELEILYRQSPSEKKKGGWQSLLVTLQELTNEKTGQVIKTSFSALEKEKPDFIITHRPK